MSNKFTGITSAGSAIPVYDKDAHEALSSKLDTTAFSSVSGEFATIDDVVAAVSGKADTSAIPSLDGYATEQWVGEQGYLTEVPAGYATTEDVISATSGLQPSGDYYSASNPSGFITSGELPDPVTIAVQEGETLDTDYDGLKIVKSTSNGNEHINLHKKSTDQWLIHGGLVPTSPGSNKYLITDSSGAMHWDNTSALAYDSAFEQSGGYITAYNGSAFKAGDELPSGVMNTSALEYNAVNEISGYNGSAIAQYGAEKQWLQHDDTLVHAANSAQYALGVNLSAVAQLLGVDETVLYSGTQTYSAVLSESVKNFDKILIEYGPNNYLNAPIATFYTDKFSANDGLRGVHLDFIEHNGSNAYCFPKSQTYKWNSTFDHLDGVGGIQYRVSGNGIQNESTGNMLYIRKIVGIGRRS